jgi:uncharacterized protein (TIGR02466 family)
MDLSTNRPSNLHSLTTTDFKQNLVEEHSMEHFKRFLDCCLHAYVPSPGAFNNGHKVEASWFTLTEQGQHAAEHNHSTSDISGAFYLQTTGQDGDIVFTNRSQLANSYPFFGQFENANYRPQEGMIILFPGYLTHKVTENRTDSQRISFSFNVSFLR